MTLPLNATSDPADTALKFLAARIAVDGVVTEEEALALRREIFPDGKVSRAEASALLRLNARVRGEGTAWRDAFVEAVTDHVLANGYSETHLSDENAEWLQRAVLADGVLDRDTEVALLVKVLERASSTPDGFHGFVRDRMFQLLTSPPPANLTEADVQLIRRVLFAEGGAGSIAVSRDEAEWIFAIDAATDGGEHHPSWRALFMQAILNHLLANAAPRLLDRATLLHRATIADAPRETFFERLRTIAAGGPTVWFETLTQPAPTKAINAYYAARAAQAAEAERLTLSEIAWVAARTRADARITANERAVLDELKRIEAEQQAAAAASGAPAR